MFHFRYPSAADTSKHISAGPILAETEKPKVLSNFFENRNRSEPTSVKHKEPNKNRNRNWEPRVTGSVEIEQNQANFLWNVTIFDEVALCKIIFHSWYEY